MENIDIDNLLASLVKKTHTESIQQAVTISFQTGGVLGGQPAFSIQQACHRLFGTGGICPLRPVYP